MTHPKVSIIILNWNGVVDTIALLNDLDKVTYPNFSVIVVDNASKDDSLGQIARLMEKKRNSPSSYRLSLLPLSKNFGFAEGNNKGLAQASRVHADYYLFLNNDTLVAPDFLTKLVEGAESDEQLVVVGPTIYYADSQGLKLNKIWYAGAWLNLFAGGAHHKTDLPLESDQMPVVATEFITGCCLLIKRSVLNKINPLFDPIFFAYSEDVDLSLKLQRLGFKLGYVPKSIIWHKLATSSGGPKSYNFWYYNIRNQMIIMRKYATLAQKIVFIGYFIFYKPIMVSLVGLIVKPRRDKIDRLIAIGHGLLDATLHRYGQRSSKP